MKAQYENDTIILYALLEKRNCANINAGARICDFARKFDVPDDTAVSTSNQSTEPIHIGVSQFTLRNKNGKVQRTYPHGALHIADFVAIFGLSRFGAEKFGNLAPRGSSADWRAGTLVL
jgi:hypothetical protein